MGWCNVMGKVTLDSIISRLKERRSIPSDGELNEFIELAELGWEYMYGKGAFLMALDKLKEKNSGK